MSKGCLFDENAPFVFILETSGKILLNTIH